jgi:hypothetical protein
MGYAAHTECWLEKLKGRNPCGWEDNIVTDLKKMVGTKFI